MEGISIDENTGAYRIKELEVSITSRCHLRCDNCGFYIPNQPNPGATEAIVDEIEQCLFYLENLKITIGSIAILGGEPTSAPILLDEAVLKFSRFKNIESIEVVTHGLTPHGLSKQALNGISKLTISVYFESEELQDLWRKFVKTFAPHVELCFRTDKEWDKWTGDERVDDLQAQTMFDKCWYRKHCVTIERKRLFLCSRIAKLPSDEEGIILTSNTSLEDIKRYLNQEKFLMSCKSCTPMMGLPTVRAGKQSDNRIEKMIPKAISYLQEQIGQ